MTDVEFGNMAMHREDNQVTGYDDIVITQADQYVLIAYGIAAQAFNEPTENLYGYISFEPLQLFVIVNGRNRQVRYFLTHDRYDGYWEAEKVGDST